MVQPKQLVLQKNCVKFWVTFASNNMPKVKFSYSVFLCILVWNFDIGAVELFGKEAHLGYVIYSIMLLFYQTKKFPL